jgi:hypothetical protein
MTVAFPSHETGEGSSVLSVHTRARLPFDLRRRRSGEYKHARPSVRVHGFENLL